MECLNAKCNALKIYSQKRSAMNDGAQSMTLPALKSIGWMLAGFFCLCGFACWWFVCLLMCGGLSSEICQNMSIPLSQASFVLAISRLGKNMDYIAFVPWVKNIGNTLSHGGFVRCGFCSLSELVKLVIQGLPKVLNGLLELSIPTASPIELT